MFNKAPFLFLLSIFVLSPVFAQEAEWVRVEPDIGPWDYHVMYGTGYAKITEAEFDAGLLPFLTANDRCTPTKIEDRGAWVEGNYCGFTDVLQLAYGETYSRNKRMIVSYDTRQVCTGSPSRTEYEPVVCSSRDVSCPDGAEAYSDGEEEYCRIRRPEEIPPKKDLGCNKGKGSSGGDGNFTDNPCNVATGNKFRSETDISTGAMTFTRYYNSDALQDYGLGKGWRGSHQKLMYIADGKLVLMSETGRAEEWTKIGNSWVGDADSDVQITQDADGYQVSNANGSYERYNFTGFITSKTNAAGETTTYSYHSGWMLHKIQDPYGYNVVFTWENNRITGVGVGNSSNLYRYEYDGLGNLVTVISPSGTLYDYDYSDNPRKIYHYENLNFPNHLTGITDENGDRYATFAYDANGKAIESELAQTTNTVGQERVQINYQVGSSVVSDAIGTQVEWSFQEILGANKLTSKVNVADGKGITQAWDANGNLLTRTDAEGRTTTYAYNATNQRTSMTVASGTPEQRTTSYEYVSPEIDLVTKTSVPSVFANNVKETINTYDADLNITSTTVNGYDTQGNAVTRTSSFAYDGMGNVISIDGPRTDVNDITTIEYDQYYNNLKKVTSALGHDSRYDQFDSNARLKRRYDENGTQFRYSYDPRGWLTSVTEYPSSGYRTTSYEYDDVGQLIKVTQPDSSTQNYVYDASHSLREVTDNLGNKVSYSYDAKGNRSNESVHDPDGTLLRNINTTYDVRNFVQSINDGGSVTQMVNDAVGNLDSQTDPNANPSTTHGFDALDRLSNTVDALANTSAYDYNVADQLTQVTAPNGTVTQFEYDDLGNQTKEISADRGTITYTHDAAGNVISMTDARGIVTNYSYDALNRLIAVTRPNTQENVTYTYDANTDLCGLGVGRVCRQEDQSGVQTFNYDKWGNLVRREVDVLGETYVTSFTYDDLNRLIETVYPNGRRVTYTRDAIGRITDVSTSSSGITTPLISNRSYRADGLSTGQTYGNGFANARTYDAQGRLTGNSLPGVGNNTYSYDNNGNILGINDSILNRQFNYDALDRLLGADNTAAQMSYTYDENSNRLSIDRGGLLENLTYEASANRLAALGGVAVTLDAAGNTLSDLNGTRQFTYNDAGRLSSLDVSGQVTSYVYNANGLRVQKVAATDTTIYHYDLSGQLIAEQDLNSGNSRDYVYVDNELITYIDSVSIQAPNISSPVQGEVLTSTSQEFTWQSDLNVTDWKLELGNQLSAKNYYDSGSLGLATSVTVTTLPEDGTEVFARLWYKVAGTWYIQDSTYTAVANVAPTPPSGTQVTMLSPQFGVNPQGDTFTWEGSSNVTSWWLYLGTNYVGGRNVLDTGNIGLVTSATSEALPGGDSILYARMWYIDGGSWLTKDFVYGVKQNWANVTMAYVHTDHLGTPKVLTDETQTVIWQAGEDAFGDAAPVVEGVVFNVRFPGQYFDSESGLSYNWNRYYDPNTGRYVTSDPIGLDGGMNTYGYVDANPLTWFDDDGLAKSKPPTGFGSSGGSENTQSPRNSTKNKHQDGQAQKKKARGGEKGDHKRKAPRKRPKGFKGPWPPALVPMMILPDWFFDPCAMGFQCEPNYDDLICLNED